MTLAAAQKNPTALGEKAPAGANVTQWSWDPLRSQMAAYIATLANRQQHFAGTPREVHPRVVKVDLGAKPRPTVVLSDCAVGGDWRLYDKQNSELPLAGQNGAETTPHRITITMIKYKGTWGASEQVSDVNGPTCTP
jgi:hypothetical protein